VRQFHETLTLVTQGKGLYAFTDRVAAFVQRSGITHGLLTLFVRHTSASLVIQENYDPDVQGDIERYFSRLVPENDPIYRHTLEGPDDMPAHVRTALTQTSLGIPVSDNTLALGTWQGIYLFEHRRGGQHRQVVLHLIGE
jgi:secondary thiamine-phosphate synthase enzyme